MKSMEKAALKKVVKGAKKRLEAYHKGIITKHNTMQAKKTMTAPKKMSAPKFKTNK